MRAGAPQVREHWHLVLGAPDAQPWPAGSEAGGEPLRAPLMRGCAVLQSAAAACIEALAAADEVIVFAGETLQVCSQPPPN